MPLNSFTLVAVATGVFVALLGLQFWGYQAGRRHKKAHTVIPSEAAAVVEGAVFALLGLLLAFQFSAAAGRLETRRHLAVREANAIGTAYLRLDLLDTESTTAMHGLFREYLESRIHAIEAKNDIRLALQAYRETESLQQTIWSNVMALSRDKPDSVRILLVSAINEMIDVTTERKTAGLTHAPITLQCYLIALAMVGAFIAGGAMSRSERLPRFHMLIFATVIATTIFMILDLEYPRLGLIRIGVADQPIYDLREMMK